MASPLTAGVAGLMLSRNPALSPDDIEACLKSSCDNIDAQNSSYIGQMGAGRINAFEALSCIKVISSKFEADYITQCPNTPINFTDLSSNTYFMELVLSWGYSSFLHITKSVRYLCFFRNL